MLLGSALLQLRSVFFVSFSLIVTAQAQVPTPTEKTIYERLKGPTTGAHRGGMLSFSPGNTMERFKSAQDAGIDVIEMDIQLSLDGIPVVFHSDLLENSSNCQGPVNQKTWEQLQSCSLNRSTEKIPSFEQVLVWNNGRSVLNAEFKTDEVILPAIELVKQHSAYEWVFFQTRNQRSQYKLAREHDAHVALLYKIINLDELAWVESLHDSRLVVIEVGKDLVAKEVSAAIHAIGKLALTNSFRLGNLAEAFGANCKKVFDFGFDIAISDNASSCVKQKKSLGPSVSQPPTHGSAERN